VNRNEIRIPGSQWLRMLLLCLYCVSVNDGEPHESKDPAEVLPLHSELLEMKDKVDRIFSALQLTPFSAATATVATDNDVLADDGELPGIGHV